MADSFVPRFKDLVRCYTTTVGTGSFALGPAMSGFGSFAESLQPGDQFYYSCIGIDKPTEREIGRGTLVNATPVARQPIGGAATSFTKGSKAIALVAAGEWFGQIDQSVASMEEQLIALSAAGNAHNAVQIAEDTARLAATDPDVPAALLTENPRGGAFRWDGSDLSALVSADPRKGIVVAPSSDATGASGAWVRQYDGPVNVRWFGCTGDGTTDDGPAFAAAVAMLNAIGTAVSIYSKSTPELLVPPGHYFLGTTTLDITSTMTIRGVGARGNQASRLRWADGVTGIRVQAYNTSGATGTKSPTYEASWTLIESLKLEGGYSGTEGESHGIHLRTQATIRDCMISGWSGDGIHARATAGAGTAFPYEGNVNVLRVENVWSHANRNGLFLKGADSNAGLTSGLNCTSNRQAGVFEASFLGNTHVGLHLEENGVTPGVVPCRVVHNGNIYCCIVGQEAWVSANAPSGTMANNLGWAYQTAGAADASRNIGPWASGTTYRAGGPYISDNQPTRRALVLGMYTEGSQPLCQAYEPSMFLGGTWGTGFAKSSTAFQQVGSGVYSDLTIKGGVAAKMALFGPQDGVIGDAQMFIDNTNSDSNIFFRRNGIVQGKIFSNNYYNRLLVQGGVGLLLGGLSYNSEQVSIDASGLTLNQGAIGYRAGAGGSVVQAVSKATGVQLNKVTGQITMNAAELAAATSVSFILTNDKIAAGDVVIVNIASGASPDSYLVNVTQVTAGSCRIQLRNVSAAPLSEVLVLNFAVIKGSST